MRILCQNIDEFLTNLQQADGTKVQIHRKTVHFSRSREKANSDGTSQKVMYHVSAVLTFEDKSSSLVEAGEECGIDRENENARDGTAQQDELHKRIEAHCELNNLNLLPGVLDF